jgi:hypothetical protein
VASDAPSWIDFVRFGISTTFDAGGGTADGFGSIDGDGGSVRGGDVGGGSGSRSISARQRAQIELARSSRALQISRKFEAKKAGDHHRPLIKRDETILGLD